jgi:hypothetical protein
MRPSIADDILTFNEAFKPCAIQPFKVKPLSKKDLAEIKSMNDLCNVS